jgi:tetratricopeptide (TPR) repeat protein
MKQLTLISAITILLFSSCGNGGDAGPGDSAMGDSHAILITKIEAQKKTMSESKMYKPQDALAALRLYSEFITKYPNDTLTPEYLFTASDLATGTGNYQQAAEYLETILSKYTMYPKYQDAMFAAALVYDSYLENVNHGDERAIQLYDQIVAKYPESYYAEQAKVLRTYVGKPDSVFFNDVQRKADSIEALKK